MIRWLWVFTFFSWHVSAKTVQNSYIRFDLPDAWHCGQENVAFVCTPTNGMDARQALIVVTAKVAGPEDNLNSFTSYLKKPKTLITKSKTSLSQPISVNHVQAAGLDWIQAIHNGSEIPNFITRYLATVKGRLAVLVSLSADQDSKKKFDPVFDQAIRSLQLSNMNPVPTQAQVAAPIQAQPLANLTAPEVPTASGQKKKFIQFGIIAVVAILGLAIIRKFV